MQDTRVTPPQNTKRKSLLQNQSATPRETGQLSLSGPDLMGLFQEVIRRDSPIRLTVRGFSMFPFVRDGDTVTIAPLERFPRLGDPVAFSPAQTEKFFIHRVVGKEGDSLLLRGDNASSADGLHPRAALIGRVVGIERRGKQVSRGLGPERVPIALLSRKGLLVPILRLLLNTARPFRKIFYTHIPPSQVL